MHQSRWGLLSAVQSACLRQVLSELWPLCLLTGLCLGPGSSPGIPGPPEFWPVLNPSLFPSLLSDLCPASRATPPGAFWNPWPSPPIQAADFFHLSPGGGGGVPAILCQVSPLSCAAPVKGGQGLPRHCVCWALTTGQEEDAKELPFLVSSQAPPEGLLEPGAPGEMGGALHSVRRWIAGPGPHSPVSATARLRCWPLRFWFCLKKAQSCPLFLPPPSFVHYPMPTQ